MDMYDTALALIGLSGRFPGAKTAEDFWQNIAGGIKSLRLFSESELLNAGVNPELLASSEYVRVGATIEDIDLFDASFFGYTRREAEMMDPQHRFFLECAWEALENAGYAPDACPGSVGVFAGSGFSTYCINNLYPHADFIETMGQFQVNMTNERDSLASMVSYKLNLKGPSIAVQTFCSTSLVAVHLACQSLLTYECDLALAGGVAISVPQISGYLYAEGGMLSPDGECRTFDANAQGSVMGNGAGVVALKRLREAIDDGDPILAVIRGSAVNNDGNLRVSYTAPGLNGQAEVIAEALGHADVEPETISYIEAHGTGTKLGDSIELAALLRVFGPHTPHTQFCALGSLKPNVGHLDRASGVTGLIKTSLALHHRQLPPTLNFTQTNQDIDLKHSPFYVNTSLQNWPASETPRRAGVNSFGLGGTNAHVVLEEAPVRIPSAPPPDSSLLLLSARTETALNSMAANLAEHLKEHPELNLADVAYTLQVGRSAFNYRYAFICHNNQEAITTLEQAARGLMTATCQTRRSTSETETLTHRTSMQPARNALERAEQLERLGQLWLAGEALNWSDLHAGERRQRVALPTYPFERQRYWIDPPEMPTQTRGVKQSVAGKLSNRANWFYLPGWKISPPSSPVTTHAQQVCWLIFADRYGLLDSLATSIRDAGQQVLLIRPGNEFRRLDATTYTLRPDKPGDYQALRQAVLTAPQTRYHFVHGWSITAQQSEPVAYSQKAYFQEQQENGFYSLLYLAQALDTSTFAHAPCISVVTNHSQSVQAGEPIVPEKSTLAGLCKVLSQEQTSLNYRFLDLDLYGTQGQPDAASLACLLRELESPIVEPLVAYRANERYRPVYRPMPLTEPTLHKQRLRKRGVYILTGGLGHIGLQLASYLAHSYQARLILVGRTQFPERESWPEWLLQHELNESVSQRIRQFQQLEAAGAEIVIACADVADAVQLSSVLDLATTRFGTVHGVIHLAGISTDEAFQSVALIDRHACELHFQPKVYSLYALQQVLEKRELDFCLLFSSLAAILGGLGFAGYTAANLFMDAFAYQQNQRSKTPWICVNWDSWHAHEESSANSAKASGDQRSSDVSLGKTIAAYVMTPEEGLDAFVRILASGLTHVVNSTGNLDARLRTWLLLEGIREEPAGSTQQISALTANNSTSSGTQTSHYENYEPLLVSIWQEALGLDEVSLYDNFFDLGGNSLNGLQVIARIRKLLRIPLSIVALFEAPTISAMATYLQTRHTTKRPEPIQQLEKRRQQVRQQSHQDGQEIAIVALSGRFPGSPTIEQFWQDLRDGKEAVTFFSEEELLAAGLDAELVRKPNYVKARPILQGVDVFDAAFFGYNPREAELLDPQHRIFLECCWEALERAGYSPENYAGLIAVFAGMNMSSYLHNLLQQPEIVASRRDLINDYQLAVSMDKDSLTTTVSYKLNLKGPSLGVQTFCSTSLVAVHLGCQSLLNGETDMVLAGGVSVRIPVKQGHLYEPGGQESADGHCRSFDALASGCMFGDGAGVVVLKRLADALEDGDLIQAVIRGSAINNDGSLKVSYSAPSVTGQAEAVIQALTRSSIDASNISYVEAHGSATELGDPIEVASLTRAFRTQTESENYCALGSVKTNVGHLDRAAGVTGLIKTVLALQHDLIPPTLHYHEPHPAIDFAHSPFYVNPIAQPWPRGAVPRRAGVNSLGMGGTNAHVIVEEAPERPGSDPSRLWQLLLLSAKTATALHKVTENLRTYLQDHPETPLADIAYTLQVGRQRFAHRRILLCRTHTEAVQALAQDTPDQLLPHYEARIDRPVAFLFPGVSELYPGAASELYEQERVFKLWVERCCELLRPHLTIDLRELLFGEPQVQQREMTRTTTLDLLAMLRTEQESPSAEANPLHQTALAQPAIFVIEYALAQLLIHWGLTPQAMFGYSVGEYVAACLAGVLTLEDALRLLARRAQLIQEQPEGAMLAVSLDEQSIQPYLNEQVSLAALNASDTCVLSGSPAAIAQVETSLHGQAIATRRVTVRHAFHSTLLKPAQAALSDLVSEFKLNPPTIPYISNVTGTWITPEQATDPAYWAKHMCQTVRCSDGLQHLIEETGCALIEVGPGQSLCAFARQHPACTVEQMKRIMPTLPAAYELQTDGQSLFNMLGKLWLIGSCIDWRGYYASERRQRVLLPTYPFERQRYWIDAPAGGSTDPIEQLNDREGSQRLTLDKWFSVPSWKRAAPRVPLRDTAQAPQSWLIFDHPGGSGEQIARYLTRHGHEVMVVLPGATFTRLDKNTCTVRPAVCSDYEAVLKMLDARDQSPQHIVHLWTRERAMSIAESLEYGFHSLLALAQALGNLDMANCQLTIISNGLYDVTGNESLDPARALLTGPCKVIPQEYPQMRCRLIDLAPSTNSDELAKHLLNAFYPVTSESIIALRGSHLWVPTFEPITLDSEDKPATAFRDKGVYLITGGLGGIGLALAAHLASEFQARLVLVGRTVPPPRQEWAEILRTETENSRRAQLICQIESLEASGAEVLIVQADVSDPEQIHTAIQQTLTTFGELHGVLHAAGVPASGLIQRKTPEMIEQVLAPKVHGTLALTLALQEIPLDFLALFSSICSTTGGGPGQVDYCAANAFLDAFAQCQRKQGRQVVAIDWGEWQWNAWEAGLAGYPAEAQQYFRARRERFGISFAEGIEALDRILQSGLSHVIVSTEDFQQMAASSEEFSTATIMQALADFQQTRPVAAYTRPLLNTPYTAPTNELESEIAARWSDLLGIEQIGIDDNFLELGGHSLLGTQLITRLRQAFQVNVRLTTLFEAPTVRELAVAIELLLIEELEQTNETEAELVLIEALAHTDEKGETYAYE